MTAIPLDQGLVVIYHMPCIDGVTCRWLVERWLREQPAEGPAGGRWRLPLSPQDVIWYPTTYGEPLPERELYEGKAVLIVDFSYSREHLETMAIASSWLQVIDHHKTARDQLRELPYALFDMEKSGARLLFDFLYPEGVRPIPPIVLYSEDRDLWQYKRLDSREIAAFLISLPLNMTEWDKANERLSSPESRDLVVAEGRGILRHTQLVTRTRAEHAELVTIGGYSMLVVNDPTYRSETGEVLHSNHPEMIVACWRQAPGANALIFDLRTHADNDIDVGAVAQDLAQRGIATSGGGHAKSAGFKINLTGNLLERLGITPT